MYLFGGGSINEGVQQELRTEVDRNILSKQDVMSLDYHYGMHIMGTSWKSAEDNPENIGSGAGYLSDKGNWELAYRLQVDSCWRMVVNTPINNTAYA